MPEGTLEGSCLCGAVRYQVDGPPKRVAHCHCTLCQKHHGAAFGSYAAYLPRLGKALSSRVRWSDAGRFSLAPGRPTIRIEARLGYLTEASSRFPNPRQYSRRASNASARVAPVASCTGRIVTRSLGSR